MLTNGYCTLIHGGTAYIIACFWQTTEAVKFSRHSRDNGNTAVVFVPESEKKPEKGDYMINEETAETDILKLVKMGAQKVMNVDVLDFGGNPHYEVGLK